MSSPLEEVRPDRLGPGRLGPTPARARPGNGQIALTIPFASRPRGSWRARRRRFASADQSGSALPPTARAAAQWSGDCVAEPVRFQQRDGGRSGVHVVAAFVDKRRSQQWVGRGRRRSCGATRALLDRGDGNLAGALVSLPGAQRAAASTPRGRAFGANYACGLTVGEAPAPIWARYSTRALAAPRARRSNAGSRALTVGGA